MRSRIFLFSMLIAVVWSILSLVVPPFAFACSCASSPPVVTFEGTAEAESSLSQPGQRDYAFEVDKVIDGSVQPSETVRVSLRSPRGGSSCGIVERLHRGGRYRIEAYESELEGKRLLFANSCGGNVALLAAPPAEDGSDPNRWLFVVAGVAVGAAAGLILRRRRRA